MRALLFIGIGLFLGWKLNDRFKDPAQVRPTIPIVDLDASEEEEESQKLAKIEIETVENDGNDSAETSEAKQISSKDAIENLSIEREISSAQIPTDATLQKQQIEKDPQATALEKIKAELSGKSISKEKTFSKLSIELSEDQLKLLEQNISQLRDTTSTIYAEGGWTVRFHEEKNFLRLIGVRDSDFIRFETLEKIKQNPKTQDLASRFEKILQSLEE